VCMSTFVQTLAVFRNIQAPGLCEVHTVNIPINTQQ